MNLLNSFLSHHLPAARKMESISNSVAVYSGEGKLFIIAMANDIITEQKKEQLLKYFEQQDQKKYFITLFEKKSFSKI